MLRLKAIVLIAKKGPDYAKKLIQQAIEKACIPSII